MSPLNIVCFVDMILTLKFAILRTPPKACLSDIRKDHRR